MLSQRPWKGYTGHQTEHSLALERSNINISREKSSKPPGVPQFRSIQKLSHHQKSLNKQAGKLTQEN